MSFFLFFFGLSYVISNNFEIISNFGLSLIGLVATYCVVGLAKHLSYASGFFLKGFLFENFHFFTKTVFAQRVSAQNLST